MHTTLNNSTNTTTCTRPLLRQQSLYIYISDHLVAAVQEVNGSYHHVCMYFSIYFIFSWHYKQWHTFRHDNVAWLCIARKHGVGINSGCGVESAITSWANRWLASLLLSACYHLKHQHLALCGVSRDHLILKLLAIVILFIF